MFVYNQISNVINTYFSRQMLHRPTDKVLKNVDTIKEKYYYNCEIQQSIYIDNYELILHHYKSKYNDVILYFPGGCFIDPPTFLHAKFAKKIARKFKKHVIMVQYPLFPIINPLHTSILIRKLIDRIKSSNIILIGDSAGACLSLYVLAGLNAANKNLIKKTILISPWFDGKLTNEDILLVQQHDFILDKQNCVTLAKDVFSKYINGRMYLCPSNENFKFNSDILLISGEHEIFTPDAKIWTQKQKVLNVKHLVYQKMCHCFILLPILEARHAIKNIKNFLSD